MAGYGNYVELWFNLCDYYSDGSVNMWIALLLTTMVGSWSNYQDGCSVIYLARL